MLAAARRAHPGPAAPPSACTPAPTAPPPSPWPAAHPGLR